MISSEDVRRVTFDKSMRGYRCEDVDHYLKQIAESMDELEAQISKQQENLVVLANRIEQYRAQEDTLSTTMINAQRLGENVIREAKQKAAEIIRAANLKADDREQRARDDVELAKQEIVTLKSEADSFKRGLLDMYRKHINLISKLPEYDHTGEEPAPAQETEPAPAQPVQEEQPPVQEPEAEPTPIYAETEPVQPVQEEQPPVQEPEPEAEPEPATEQPEAEKVDTVEFAIAPHEDEPEKPRAAAPVEEEPRFQPGAGLYDDEPPAPARKSRKSSSKRGTRKEKPVEPPETLEFHAFDDFEGVDFDS